MLTLDGQEATVEAGGGRVSGYRVEGRDVLAGAENPNLFAFRGSLLAPWPNRVVGGRWAWQGREFALPVNDPGAGAALHGLVYDADWTVEHVDSSAISLAYALPERPGYPFPLRLTAAYELRSDGLVCSLTALNVGPRPAPIGLGVHPYIAAPALVDEFDISIPAGTFLQTDAAWQETGRPAVTTVGMDFRLPRRLGDLALDTAFTDVVADAAGRSEVRVGLPDGAQVTLWAGSTCRWWLVYTGHTLPTDDFRRSLAVEPMTCPPNALNTGEIDIVAPGDALGLEWGFSLR